MARLFAWNTEKFETVIAGEHDIAFDVECPLLSLPYRCHTDRGNGLPLAAEPRRLAVVPRQAAFSASKAKGLEDVVEAVTAELSKPPEVLAACWSRRNAAIQSAPYETLPHVPSLNR